MFHLLEQGTRVPFIDIKTTEAVCLPQVFMGPRWGPHGYPVPPWGLDPKMPQKHPDFFLLMCCDFVKESQDFVWIFSHYEWVCLKIRNLKIQSLLIIHHHFIIIFPIFGGYSWVYPIDTPVRPGMSQQQVGVSVSMTPRLAKPSSSLA